MQRSGKTSGEGRLQQAFIRILSICERERVRYTLSLHCLHDYEVDDEHLGQIPLFNLQQACGQDKADMTAGEAMGGVSLKRSRVLAPSAQPRSQTVAVVGLCQPLNSGRQRVKDQARPDVQIAGSDARSVAETHSSCEGRRKRRRSPPEVRGGAAAALTRGSVECGEGGVSGWEIYEF